MGGVVTTLLAAELDNGAVVGVLARGFVRAAFTAPSMVSIVHRAVPLLAYWRACLVEALRPLTKAAAADGSL